MVNALRHLPETSDTLAAAIEVRCEIRNALTVLGEPGRVFDHLREAEALALRLNDHRRRARVVALVSQSYMIVGDHDQALEAGQRALHLAEAANDLDAEVMANAALGVASYHRGDFRQCIRFSRRNIELLTAELITQRFGLPIFPAVSSRCFLACCLAHMGNFAQALAIGKEAVHIAEQVGHPYSQVHADFQLGCILNVIRATKRRAHRIIDRHAQRLLPTLPGALRVERRIAIIDGVSSEAVPSGVQA